MSETLKFLCRQFYLTPTKVNPQKSNLCGQTGIVTGSNIGLGLEASRQLLELGLSRVGRFQRAKGYLNFLFFQQPQVLRHLRSIVHLQALQEIALIELCCTVPSSKGIVNIVNSGFCYGSALHTEVTTRFPVLGIIVTFAKRMIGRSTSVGARTLVDAAVVQGPASHGQYLSDCARYT